MRDLQFYITAFTSNLQVFKSLTENLSEQQIIWKQEEGKWNMLEIICHLYDEEREDFGTRLRSVLDDPAKPFPSINPQGWVTEREYAKQDFNTMRQKFFEERNNSLQWLQQLEKAAWDNTYNHPSIGPMSAKFILANWQAHDYLHIRQITRLKYDYLPYLSAQSLSYAGNW